RCALLALATLSLAFAPAPLPKPNRPPTAKGDLRVLQGRWLQVDVPGGAGAREPLNLVLTVTGDRFTFRRDGRVVSEWTVRLDPAKRPGALNLHDARPG